MVSPAPGKYASVGICLGGTGQEWGPGMDYIIKEIYAILPKNLYALIFSILLFNEPKNTDKYSHSIYMSSNYLKLIFLTKYQVICI